MMKAAQPVPVACGFGVGSDMVYKDNNDGCDEAERRVTEIGNQPIDRTILSCGVSH